MAFKGRDPGIINNVFIKKRRIKLYNTLAIPVLFYGSETWTIKTRDARRITAVDEIHDEKSRIHFDRLKNKCTNCKGV